MPKQTKAKPSELIGFIYGKPFGTGIIHIFKNKKASTVEDQIKEFQEKYDKECKNISGRYALTDESDVHYDELCKKLAPHSLSSTIYQVSVQQTVDALKEITGAKKLTHFAPANKVKKEKKEKSDDPAKKAPKKAPKAKAEGKKKTPAKKAEKEEKEDKEDAKKTTKKSVGKKAKETDDTEEETKKKKTPAKKNVKKESEEEDAEESEDESSDDDKDGSDAE